MPYSGKSQTNFVDLFWDTSLFSYLFYESKMQKKEKLTKVELCETRRVKDSYSNKVRARDFGYVIFFDGNLPRI